MSEVKIETHFKAYSSVIEQYASGGCWNCGQRVRLPVPADLVSYEAALNQVRGQVTEIYRKYKPTRELLINLLEGGISLNEAKEKFNEIAGHKHF